MRRAAIVAAAAALFVLPANAASPAATTTIQTYEAVAADPAKLKIFCEMIALPAMSEEADAAKMEGYLDKLGPEFRAAWSSAEDADVNGEDSERVDEVIGNLYVACGQ